MIGTSAKYAVQFELFGRKSAMLVSQPHEFGDVLRVHPHSHVSPGPRDQMCRVEAASATARATADTLGPRVPAALVALRADADPIAFELGRILGHAPATGAPDLEGLGTPDGIVTVARTDQGVSDLVEDRSLVGSSALADRLAGPDQPQRALLRGRPTLPDSPGD